MNETSDSLQFSDDGLSNRPLFLSGLNDVNIFVEDVGKEYIYEEIFERLLGDSVKFFCIFPLGGKAAVLQQHRVSELYDNNKPNIFIVDGDFDNLWDDKKELAPNLIYLDRYNIESYFCTKDSVTKYMRGFLKKPREQVENLIHYDEWLRNFQSEFGNLFSLFAITQYYSLDLPNVRLSLSFLDANGRLLKDKYKEYNDEFEAQIRLNAIPMESVLEKKKYLILVNSKSNFSRIICGKCQFESLCRHIKMCCGKTINRDTMRNSLIMSFDLEPLQFIRDKILQILSLKPSSKDSA